MEGCQTKNEQMRNMDIWHDYLIILPVGISWVIHLV